MNGFRSSLAGLLFGTLALAADPGISDSADSVQIDGAKPGHWTMDFDAAQELAARRQLPLLLNFTGSDWCSWCKIMDESVFETKEWREFATSNVVLVTIDFPRGKGIVPAKWVERNSLLKRQFEVRGYPTYVVLGPDGATKLGHLVANRGKTPESFIQDFRRILAKNATGSTESTAGESY